MGILGAILGNSISSSSVATTLYGIPSRGFLGFLPLAAYGIPSPGIQALKNGDVVAVSNNILCNFNNKLMENKNLQLAVLALVKYVANVDNEVTIGEKNNIDKFANKICYLNSDMQDQVNSILEETVTFDELVKKYFTNIDKETFKLLDDYVMLMVNADNKVSDKEKEFLHFEWESLKRSFE